MQIMLVVDDLPAESVLGAALLPHLRHKEADLLLEGLANIGRLGQRSAAPPPTRRAHGLGAEVAPNLQQAVDFVVEVAVGLQQRAADALLDRVQLRRLGN